MKARRAREDDEVRDRSEQPRGTWEEVYKNAKKADRNKNDLHERDDGELERTGQPLCIYEPYFGQGSWSFLHTNSLYRGIRLAGECLKREKDRVSHYLHSNSEPKLLEMWWWWWLSWWCPSQPNPNLNLAAARLTPGDIGGVEGPDRIFVGGLLYYFTEVQIRELLESFGPLRGFDLVKDRDTGNSKGYGLCVYEDQAATDVACAALNGLKKGRYCQLFFLPINIKYLGVIKQIFFEGCLSWNLKSRLDDDELSPEQVNDVKDFIGDYVARN
ncbi:unnamed protein product [Lactuca saligna]|uniref:RRM domain-containing protein n=1 Tax=Lactuca saligna TaxID=75948 RepID=A0AA35ZXT6_LACSI|nr:unnamed protein product [Lactuca saligna]